MQRSEFQKKKIRNACPEETWGDEQLLIFYSSFLCVFVHIYFYVINPSCSQKITTKLLLVVMEVKK